MKIRCPAIWSTRPSSEMLPGQDLPGCAAFHSGNATVAYVDILSFVMLTL